MEEVQNQIKICMRNGFGHVKRKDGNEIPKRCEDEQRKTHGQATHMMEHL
jgi:hypothetical protein